MVIKGGRKGEDDKKEGQGGREWRCKWRSVSSEREKGRENRDKCEDDGGENEREIRRLDNERESEKGGGRERQGVGTKKRKVGYWE